MGSQIFLVGLEVPIGLWDLNNGISKTASDSFFRKDERVSVLIKKLEEDDRSQNARQLRNLASRDSTWRFIVHLELLDKLVERPSIDDSLLQKLFKQLQFAQDYDGINKKASLIQKELNEERSRIEDRIYKTLLEEPTNSDDLKTFLQNLSTNLTENSKFNDQLKVIAKAVINEPTDFKHLEELLRKFELMYRDRFDSITLKNTVSISESNASSIKSIEELLSGIDPLLSEYPMPHTPIIIHKSEDPIPPAPSRINYNHELATVLIQAEFYLQSGNFEEAMDLLSLSYEYFKQDGRRTLWIDELLRYRIDENSTEGLDHLRPTSLKQKGKVGIPRFHNNVQTFVLPILFPSDLELFDKKKIILQGLDPLDPTRIIHLLELGRIAKKRGNLGEAEKILQEAYSLSLYHSYIGNRFQVSLSFEPGFDVVREIVGPNLVRFHLGQFPQKEWTKNSDNSFQVDKHLKKVFSKIGIYPSEIVIVSQKRNKEKISFTIQSAQSVLAEQKLKSWFSQVREKGISVCSNFDCNSSSCAADPFIAYIRRNSINNLTFSSIEYLETLIQVGKTKAARNFLNSCDNYDEIFYSVCERLWKKNSKELCNNFINDFFPEEIPNDSSLNQPRDTFEKFSNKAFGRSFTFAPRNPDELIGFMYAMDRDYSKSREQVNISIDSRRKKFAQEWEYENADTIVANWIVDSEKQIYLETLIHMGKTKEAKNFLKSCDNYFQTFYSVLERLWKNDSKELCTNFVNEFFPEETLDESSLSQARDAFQKFAYNAAFENFEYIPSDPNELIGFMYAMDRDYSKSREQVNISIDSRRKKLGQEWEYENAFTIVANWIVDKDKRAEFIKKGNELKKLVQITDPFLTLWKSIEVGDLYQKNGYSRKMNEAYREALKFAKSQGNEKKSKFLELQMLINNRLGDAYYRGKDLLLNEKLEQSENYYLDGIEVFEKSNDSLNVMNIFILAQLHLNLVGTYKEMKNDQGAIDAIEKLLFILSHLPLSFEDCSDFNRQLQDFFISTDHSAEKEYLSEFDARLKDYEERLKDFFLEKLYEFNSIPPGRDYEIDDAFKYFEENFKGEYEENLNLWVRNRNRLYHFFVLLNKFEQKLKIPSSNKVKVLSLLRGMTLSPKKSFNLYASVEHLEDLIFSSRGRFSRSGAWNNPSLIFEDLYFELGKCYKRLNRYDKAINYYERGISDFLEFKRFDISKIGLPTKKTVEEEIIEELILEIDQLLDSTQLSTDLPAGLFEPMRECALLYALTGDMDKALEYYRLTGEPEKELHGRIALYLIENKDLSKAMQLTEAIQAWNQAGKPVVLTRLIVSLCEEVGKFDEADEYSKMLPQTGSVKQLDDLHSEYRKNKNSRISLLKQKKYTEALELYMQHHQEGMFFYSSPRLPDTDFFYFLILQDLHPEYHQTDYKSLEKEILEARVKNDDVPLSETFKEIATSYFAFSKQENLDQNESLFYLKRAIEVQKELIKSKTNEDIELFVDYFALGKYQLAFRDIKEALESFEKSISLSGAPELAHAVGKLLFDYGVYLEAIQFYKSALKQGEKDVKNADLSILYNQIGISYYYLGNEKKAQENFLKAIEQIHDQNETIANIRLRKNILLNQGILYYRASDFVSAIECYERVIYLNEILSFEEEMDENDYGTSLLRNTECQLKLGNYTKAEQNFIKWVKWNVSRSKNKTEIWEKIWEKNLQFAHIIEMEPQLLKKFAYFADIENLRPRISAEIFRSLGDYYYEISLPKNACHYFKKALTKLQQVQDNDRQAEAKINLRIGNLIEESEATEYLEQALSIYQDLEGNESYNVAECYASMGRYEKALFIYTKIHGPIHSDIGSVYYNMSFDEVKKENLPKALEYAKKSLKIMLKSKNRNLPAIPEAYFLLGRLHVEMKEYKNALEYLKKAAEMVKILDEGFDYNSKRSEFINNWMLVCASELKDDKLAEELANNQLGIREKYLLEYFPQLGQSDKMERMRWDILGHCFRHVSPYKFAQYILRTKGLVLDSIIEDEKRMKSSENPKVKELVNKKDSLERALRIVQSDPKLLAREKEIRSQLGHVSERLAEENFRRQYEALTITLGQVQRKLPANSVLVEFIEYPTFNADDGFLWDEEKYGAVILFPNTKSDSNVSNIQPVRIFFENEKDIKKHLAELLIWSGDSDSTFPKHALPELYRLVAKPIIDQLPKNIDSLILSPDGILTFLPFSALYENPSSPFLAEQFNLFQVSSGRDLLDEFETFHSKTITLFGNPEYKKAVPFPQREENLLAMQMEDNEHFRNLSLAPLPGTAEEVGMLQNLVNGSYQTTPYLGQDATEENLRQVQNPGILHLATHGFFIESPDKIKSNSGQSRFFGFNTSDKAELSNPMRRAGLALAGAQNTFDAWAENKSTISENDGIFTGEEAAVLNLKNTWLTTLSACETGKGSTMPGEGVFGLRRAFSQAGTQNLLLTLWPASDKHSVPFMKSFYEAALKDGDAANAFVKVQRELLVQYREEFSLSQAVRYIAPFVLTFRGPCPEMEAPPISTSMASIQLSAELKDDFLSKYAMFIIITFLLMTATYCTILYRKKNRV